MENQERNPEAKFEIAKGQLKKLLAYSDELPEEFYAHLKRKNSDFKYRANWFQRAASSILFLCRKSGDEQLLNDTEQFVTKWRTRHETQGGVRTTREEINEMDMLINRALQN